MHFLRWYILAFIFCCLPAIRGAAIPIFSETVTTLNLRIRNSAVSEFAVNPKRLALVTFNTLPHLDSAEHAGWVTHT
ncbi:MAG: hypothetical protein BWY83_02208 [bacterium ADurb.Bin478]|nr:MAG: hypothetical protein BWY83_02208 [bacterium ADurb.Bin478]